MNIWELKLGEEALIFYDVTNKLGSIILRHYMIDDLKRKGTMVFSDFELTCNGRNKAIDYYAPVIVYTANTEKPLGVIFEWISLGIRIVAATPKMFAEQPAEKIISNVENFVNDTNVKELKIIVSQKTKFSVK